MPTETHKGIRNAITDKFVGLQNEKIRNEASKTAIDARLTAIGNGIVGTGGVGTGAQQTGEIGDTVDGVIAILASADSGFKGIAPSVSGLSFSAITLATGAAGTLTVFGADFLPYPLVKLDPASGADIDVSASVVMRSSGQFDLTIPSTAPAGTYQVYIKNPLDTTAADVTSTQTAVLTRS